MSKFSYYVEMYRKTRILKNIPRIWNYVKYRTLPRKSKMLIDRYSPQIASIILTKRCNLTCSFCSVGNSLNQKNWRDSEATLEKVKRIFKNPLFSNALGVDLLGGEPMLNKDIIPIIKWLSNRGHLINMNTNGLRLDKNINELKEAGISRISISLYEDNEKYLYENLEKINKIFPVHTSIVLAKKDLENNQEKILQKTTFLKKTGCRSLNVMIYRPQGLNPNPDEIVREDLPSYIQFKQLMEKNLPGFVNWPSAIQTKKIKKRCPQIWQRISVTMKGNMEICCGTEEILSGPNSNFFDCEDKPDLLFNHPTLVNLREQLLDENAEPPEMCKTCNLIGDPGW